VLAFGVGGERRGRSWELDSLLEVRRFVGALDLLVPGRGGEKQGWVLERPELDSVAEGRDVNLFGGLESGYVGVLLAFGGGAERRGWRAERQELWSSLLSRSAAHQPIPLCLPPFGRFLLPPN
jgi:hypothetical protein